MKTHSFKRWIAGLLSAALRRRVGDGCAGLSGARLA